MGSRNGKPAYLMVDPARAKRRPGQGPGDILAQAVALFRAKEWSGGQRPGVVLVNPKTAAEVAAVAQALGLATVADGMVQAGIWWLGVAGGD